LDAFFRNWSDFCSRGHCHASLVGTVSYPAFYCFHHLICFARYAFPSEPVDGIIDLTADEKAFYFNPYSGELSLEFPKAERKCKGGILA
jgi:DNA repair protein RAD5